MKNTIKAMTLLTLFSSTMGAALSANAAEAEGGTLTSTGKVTFKPNTGEGSVTPPEKPEKPGQLFSHGILINQVNQIQEDKVHYQSILLQVLTLANKKSFLKIKIIKLKLN